MRNLSTAEVNKYRMPLFGIAGTEEYGAFNIPFRSFHFYVIADNGATTGWEHVSVSLKNRCPNWEEMCYIKDLFFDPEETVVQYHPKESEYINNHDYCLHLWKKPNEEYQLPPSNLIGMKVAQVKKVRIVKDAKEK